MNAVAFVQPLLLLGLIALPILWLILRAVPPAAKRLRFAAVMLLLGLTDETRQADRTPWWLLMLRIVALGAAIIGFAGPVLNPTPQTPGSGSAFWWFWTGAGQMPPTGGKGRKRRRRFWPRRGARGGWWPWCN